MSNPPALVVPTGPQGIAFGVQVFVNGVDANGLPVAVLDTTSPLSFEDVQNASAVSRVVDPANNRRVIVKSIVPFTANGDQPFSFRVKCAAVTSGSIVTASGTAQKAVDQSQITWDGVAPGPA